MFLDSSPLTWSTTEINVRFCLPPEEAEAMEDFLESLIEERGRLSLRLVRSRNPTLEASNNFAGIWSCPRVSSISSSDIFFSF